MILRPYQSECGFEIARGFSEGHRKQLTYLPTGGGKTVVFLSEAQRRLQMMGQDVLILAHRDDLVRQPVARAADMGMVAHVEKAGEYAPPDARLVVASVQSLWNERGRLAERKWGLVIADEAHHSLSPKWARFLNRLDDMQTDFLGVTATPHRHDGMKLGEWWGRVAYEITLPELVKQGYLAPIMVECLPVSLEVPRFGKEVSAEMADALLQPVLRELARAVVAATRDRKRIVVFLPLIRTSRRFAELLTEAGLPAAHVDGEMGAERKEIEARFRAGEFRALCNSMVLTEGWDEPCVDCVVPLRPVVSSSLYQQMVGRGTRLFPGKVDMLLLDLLWQTKRHLARPASLFSGDPELSYLASTLATGKRKDLAALAEDTGKALEVARLASMARKVQKEKRRKAFRISYESLCGTVNLTPGVPGIGTGPRASEKQVALLKNFKMEVPEGLSSADASTLIGRLMTRNPFRRR